MRILTIIVLLVLLAFLYEDNLNFKKDNKKNIKLIKQLNQTIKKNIILKKEQTLLLENSIEILTYENKILKKHISKEENRKYIYKKEKILDFKNLLKKEEKEKEEESNYLIKPDLEFDKENNEIKLKGLKIEIKTKF